MPLQATLDADFSQFLGELDRTKRELQRWTPDVAKVSKGLDRLSDSLDGSKTFTEAAKVVAAIDRIGGATNLTQREARRLGPAIDEGVAKFLAMGQKVPPEIAKAKTELDRLRQSTNSAGNAAESLGAKLTRGLSNFTAGLGVGVGASVAMGAGNLVRDLAGEATELTPLWQGFERMQGGAAGARRELQALRDASRGLVSTTDLLRASNEANVLGLGKMGLEFDKVVSVAQRLGRVVGKDATTSVADLTNALGRGSSEVLNNLGIQLRANDAYQEFARRNNLVASELTDVQKQMAFATIGFERAAEAADALGEQELTVWEEGTRVVTVLSDIAVAVLSAGDDVDTLAEALGGLADVLTKIRDVAPNAMQQLRKETELTLKTAMQTSLPGAFAVAGPFGALFQAIAKARLGAIDPVDLRRLNAASRTSDIQLAPSPKDSPAAAVTRENKELERAIKERQRLIAQLTGRDALDGSLQRLNLAREIGVDRLSSSQAMKLFDDLIEARQIATRIAPELAAGITQGLADLAQRPDVKDAVRTAGAKIFSVLADPKDLSKLVQQGAARAIKDAELNPLPDLLLPQIGLGPDLFSSTGIAGAQSLEQLLGGTNRKLAEAAKTTRTWRLELSGVSQALSQMAQVTGGLDGLVREIGRFVTALESAEQLVTSIAKAFNKDFNFAKSAKGQSAAAGLAGGLLGWELGGLTTSRAGGAALGATGGAAAGIPAAAATGGMSVLVGALVGGISGYFSSAKTASNQRKLKDLQADQLVAEYGSLNDLLDVVGRLGMNQQTFLERFYGEPQEFAKGINELTIALRKEQKAAEELGESLGDVAKRQGVLSRADVASIAGLRAGGPGDDALRGFLESQSDLTLRGLQRAGSALQRMVTVGDDEIAQLRKEIEQELGTRDADAVSSALSTRTEALRDQKAADTIGRFGSAAGGLGAGLLLEFTSLTEQGYTTADALAMIQEPATALDDILTRTGQNGGAAFEQLRGMLAIANDTALQPALDLGLGLGEVIAGLGNRALLSGEAFSQLAGGVAESYFEMEALGHGGADAARLLQNPLQNIWQLQQDFGYEVDANTQKLLDFAESSGLIGDKFRPAAERTALGIETLIVKFDEFLDRLGPGLETAAGKAGGLLSDLRKQAEFPSLPGNPDATWKVNAELTGGMEVRVGEADVSIELDGDVLADAVIRRLPGRVEMVGG